MVPGAVAMEGMPVGEDNFRELRDKDLYFVDKSGLIDEILRSTAKVTLITRPRRFGKSLNLSMLDTYLNIEYADGPDRFSGLMITDIRPDDPEKNANYVINLDFKDLITDSYEMFEISFRNKVIGLFNKFPELRDSEKLTPDLQRWYRELTEGTADYDTLAKSVAHLSRMIEMHHGRKPIILIDEYDRPMNNTYGDKKLHEAVKGLVKNILGPALKGNDSLRFAVVTGIMRISKESIFSDLNNLEVNDVFSDGYDEMYGFSQKEVEKLLEDNGHPEKIAEAQEWYDGYRFGSQDVYNPWSIIRYVKTGYKAKKYWTGTSGNSIIGDLLRKTDQETWKKLNVLYSGGSVEAKIKLDIAYSDLHSSRNAIFSVMVAAGYLKAVEDDGDYYVSIPNKEMFIEFSDMVIERFDNDINDVLENFIDAMKGGDLETMTSKLRELMEMLSVRILTNEFPYEAFIIGLMATERKRYEIQADRESGNGYFDIRMRSISGQEPNILLEVKRRNKKNAKMSMDRLAQSALEQIHKNGYAYGLKGDTILYGVAFDSKIPTVVMDRMSEQRGLRKERPCNERSFWKK